MALSCLKDEELARDDKHDGQKLLLRYSDFYINIHEHETAVDQQWLTDWHH